MEYKTIYFYILIITILLVVCYNIFKRNKTEQFKLNETLTQMYNIGPPDMYQIGQIHHPFYNWPEYIGKYPYYRYMFHPYNSAVYY